MFLWQALLSAVSELPMGGSHALLTCLQEWEGGRLPSSHLVSFARSIAWQSPSLYYLRPLDEVYSSTAELLSPAEMQALKSGNCGTGLTDEAERRLGSPAC